MLKPMILDVECIVCNKSLQKINHDPLDVTRKMGKITCRRSRTPNWSIEEKKYLLELIKERKDVVVIKNNNGPHYSEEKDVAWNEILRNLSLKFGNKFSVSSTKKVKTQWQNMKRIARDEIALIGPSVEKFSRQTFEVCNILDMIKDGVLKRDNMNMNDTIAVTNVEIKTERLDEEPNEPSCSGLSNIQKQPTPNQPVTINNSSDSSASDANDFEMNQEIRIPQTRDYTSVFESEKNRSCDNSDKIDNSLSPVEPIQNVSTMTMTEDIGIDNILNPFHRQLKEFLRYTSDEKALKMESLKEERRVARTMRETAELHKIIAEQKLKHVLWIKKHEMA